MSERLVRSKLSPGEQERREQYRQRLGAALNRARQYNGSEVGYTELMDALLQLETTVGSMGLPGDIRSQEISAAFQNTERNPRDINDILSVAGDSQRKKLSLEQASHPYVYLQFKGIFLHPGTAPSLVGLGEGRKKYEVRFDTIVNDFITFLRSQNIFADDVIITLGQEPEDMMRQESYIKIEIPRIGKTVLLCNQIGEATFVLQGYVPDQILTDLTKDDLQDNKLFAARKVVRGPQWQNKLAEFLFNEDVWDQKAQREKNPRHKIPLQELHQLRQRLITEMKLRYTPEKWAGLEVKQMLREKILGKGIVAIASILGLSTDPSKTTRSRLQLGLVIWPDSTVLKKAIEIEERTPEQWREAIIAAGWTPEKWAETEPRKIDIDDHKISFLVSTFAVPVTNSVSQIALFKVGLVVWPDSTVLKKAIEIEERTPEQWREAIIAAGWTPEKWEKITDSFVFKHIDGRGLAALSSVFSLPPNNSNRSDRLRLGLAIWPDSILIKRAIEIDERGSDQWREAIIAAGWTPEKFLATPARSIDIDTYKITALGHIFKVEGNPIQRYMAKLGIAMAIWPDNPELLKNFEREQVRLQLETQAEALTPDQWRKAFEDISWTPGRWASATHDQADNIVIKGLKLNGIARKFQVAGNPVNNRAVFFELGLAIWPNDPLILEAQKTVKANRQKVDKRL